jgi:uncharacterized protein (TIGR02099 family)
VIRKTALWFNRVLWSALLIALLLVASYVSLGRYYIGYVENYQQDLIERFVDLTGLPLEIEKLTAYWSELSPVLEMTGLSLSSNHDTKAAVLSVQEVDFEINPISSFLLGTPQIKRLELIGLRFSIEEYEPGLWRLKNYAFESKEGGDFNNIVDLLLAADRIHLEQSFLELHPLASAPVLLKAEELSLNRSGDFRRIRLFVGLEQTNKVIEVLVEAQGDPREKESFEANSYAKVDDIDFKRQLPLLRSLGVEINEAQLDAELWANVRSGGRWFVEGKVSTPLIDFSTKAVASLEPLKDLDLIFLVEKDSNDKLQIWFPELKINWREESLHLPQLKVSKNGQQYQFQLPSLNLALVHQQLNNTQLLGKEGESILDELKPSGELQNVHLYLRGGEETEFSLQAQMKQLSVHPWRGAPGLEGVSGYLELTKNNGLVVLDTDRFVMSFPNIYSEPLEFSGAQAAVGWAIDDELVAVDSGPIYLQSDHGPAAGLLRLRLPKEKENDSLMTLLVGLQNTNANRREKFIPEILSEKLRDWLSGSIQAGYINQAGFVYRGSLSKDDGIDRTVQVFVDTENADLDYHADWPGLKNVSGLVVVDDDELWVDVDKGSLYDLAIEGGRAYLQTEAEGTDWLQVNASSHGPARDALSILRSDGLKNIVGNSFDYWQLQGQVSSEVTLKIPLDGDDEVPSVNVTVELKEGQLNIEDYQLAFDGVHGVLGYSNEKGLFSRGMKGAFFGKPLDAAVSQDKNVIKIELDGSADMADVYAWTGQPALGFFNGQADFQTTVILNGKQSKLGIESSLSGVAIDLPSPMGKKTDQVWPFLLTMPIGVEDSVLRMSLADRVELELLFAQRNFSGGKITLGSLKKPEVPLEKKSFSVTGAIEDFDLSVWQPIYDRYLSYEKQGKATKKEIIEIKVQDLSVGTLSAFDIQWQAAELQAQRSTDAWMLGLSNSEMDVDVKIPDQKHQPYHLKFARLNLPKPRNENSGALEGIDPSGLIDTEIEIEQLFLGEELLGDIGFSMTSQSSGLLLENIKGNLRGVQLGTVDSPLVMLWLKDGEHHQSFFNGGLLFANFGDVLSRWGYERAIESKNGLFDLSLAWPGRPDQWLLEKSEGDVTMDIDEGRFLTTSSGTSGTLKVVGILNFSNLMRRLKLDFSDITDEGVTFDAVDGRFRLDHGELMIVDNLVVKSPSSSFQLRGNADLEQELLDMELVATLPVADNLPWVAAIAGGLPTAAGVYVASKLFEKSVDKLSSAVYSIKGDWNEPEMKFERMFSDKTKLSKNKSPSKRRESKAMTEAP